jgi:hypothetical protein
VTKRKLDRVTVAEGAWMIKCNPEVWDIEGFMADGRVDIEGWRVQRNYRVGLMEAGDPCYLWVSGSRRAVPPGVWGKGTIAGDAGVGDGDEYWFDETEGRAKKYIPLELRIVPRPALKSDLVRDARFASAEVIRVAQAGNPLFVTEGEVGAIEDLL